MSNCRILLGRAIVSSSATILSSSVKTTARQESGLPQNEDQRLAGTHSGFVTLLRVAGANDRFFPDGSRLFEAIELLRSKKQPDGTRLLETLIPGRSISSSRRSTVSPAGGTPSGRCASSAGTSNPRAELREPYSSDSSRASAHEAISASWLGTRSATWSGARSSRRVHRAQRWPKGSRTIP
jgi:hypothetical protein